MALLATEILDLGNQGLVKVLEISGQISESK
jgi:hypothetical protein